MSDMLRRLDQVPPQVLREGWSACVVTVEQGRIHFGEASQHTWQRSRFRLRRRLRWLAAGLVLWLLLPLAGTVAVGASLAVVGLFLVLGGLDGLRGDLRRGARRFEFAVLDPRRNEIELRGPRGHLMYAPLAEVRMFMVVTDPHDGRHHLVLVGTRGAFLPWLSTPSASAAVSLAWLLGFIADRPARRLETSLAEAADQLDAAADIRAPQAPR